MANKITSAENQKALGIVTAYAKQEGKIAAQKAKKHGKAAAKVVSEKAHQAFAFIKKKLR